MHYWWSVKADILRPEIYAAIVVVLLGFRVMVALPKRLHRRAVPARASSTLSSN